MLPRSIGFTGLRKQGLLYFLVGIVLIGIFLRCINLGQKPYWFDETYTLLRVSSYSEQDAVQELLTGQIIEAGDFLKYQSLSSEKGAIETIAGLAQEEPQLPPLYFLAAKFWAQCFGTSKAAMRSLSVIGGLLSFPVIYWLCLELFASSAIGWMAMALFAVSPINLRYAQEIRPYSFWLTLILITCVLLLRSIRQPTKSNWGLYTFFTIMALYCHLLTGLVTIAQGLYVLGIERFRITRVTAAYGMSLGISIVGLLPWFWIVWSHRKVAAKMLAWTSVPMPLNHLIQGAGTSLSQIFFAWHLKYHYPFIYLAIPILIFILYALYFLCSDTSIRVWLFIFAIAGVTALPFLLADLLLGGRRSLNERYFLVCYVILLIAVAYLLISKLTNRISDAGQSTAWQSTAWQWITVVLLSGSLLSCGLGSFDRTWWGWSEFDVEIPLIVQATPHPLVVSDMPLGFVMPLARELQPQTQMQLLGTIAFDHLDFPDQFSHIFLYNPSEHLLSTVKQQYSKPELVYYLRDPATTNQFFLYQINFSKKLGEGQGDREI